MTGISEAYENIRISLHKSSGAIDIFSRYLGDIVRNKVRPRDTVPSEDKQMVDWALIKMYAKNSTRLNLEELRRLHCQSHFVTKESYEESFGFTGQFQDTGS